VNWSWVTTADLVTGRRNHARQLTGYRLAAVSYVLIDYGLLDRSTGPRGPRLISDAQDLALPAWRYETFDSADYAVEFTTEAGRVFTFSWDSPGYHTGVWLREVPGARVCLRRWRRCRRVGRQPCKAIGQLYRSGSHRRDPALPALGRRRL
jgi:hypothetical protein